MRSGVGLRLVRPSAVVQARRPLLRRPCRRGQQSSRMAGVMRANVSMADFSKPTFNAHEFSTFIFDCDGVLWHGADPIEGSLEMVSKLREAGKRVFFVTNNATKHRRTLQKRFAQRGLDVPVETIITAGSATAEYLVSRGLDSVYLVGEPGLAEELTDLGIRIVRDPENAERSMSEAEFAAIDPYPAGVKAVVDATDVDSGSDDGTWTAVQRQKRKVSLLGLPELHAALANNAGTASSLQCAVSFHEAFSYRTLAMASVYVQAGAKLIGTNPDGGDRCGSFLIPGTGPFVRAVEAAANARAVIIGKPERVIIDTLLQRHGVSAAETMMVGDRLDTDCLFANNAGVSSCLVLTGCTSEAEVRGLAAGDPRAPRHVLRALADLPLA